MFLLWNQIQFSISVLIYHVTGTGASTSLFIVLEIVKILLTIFQNLLLNMKAEKKIILGN